MKRNAIQDLINWKNDEERKPLVLKGARQVGKTWLMKEFGKNYYKSFVYFNFDEDCSREFARHTFSETEILPGWHGQPARHLSFEL